MVISGASPNVQKCFFVYLFYTTFCISNHFCVHIRATKYYYYLIYYLYEFNSIVQSHFVIIKLFVHWLLLINLWVLVYFPGWWQPVGGSISQLCSDKSKNENFHDCLPSLSKEWPLNLTFLFIYSVKLTLCLSKWVIHSFARSIMTVRCAQTVCTAHHGATFLFTFRSLLLIVQPCCRKVVCPILWHDCILNDIK